MADSGGVKPPSGSDHPPPSLGLPEQVHTKMEQSYTVKGDTAIRNWVKHFFPAMSEKQVNLFVERFTMTICQQINQQISKELKRARESARKLRKSEEGTD